MTVVAISTIEWRGDELPPIGNIARGRFAIEVRNGISYVVKREVHVHAIDQWQTNRLGIWSLPAGINTRVAVSYVHTTIEPTDNRSEALQRAIGSGAFDENERAFIRARLERTAGASALEPENTPVSESREDFQERAVVPAPVRQGSEASTTMILYGPPGTGKTYNTAVEAVRLCRGAD